MSNGSISGRKMPRSILLSSLLLSCLLIVFLLVSGGAAEAGSCAKGIDRMQARLDRALEARAAAGSFAPESARATRGVQPTPATIAAAESRYDGWPAGRRAVAALKTARRAEAAGKPSTCRTALRTAEREIARPPR
ncbi:hypothetical protein [Methylobacterium sp. 77]|uniref:hypothetical protein n=1 Tax=Methylobacterium sp. 77 TaxID=1101192 RepID=UPI00037554A1|nr:hypothetical protein [Methylobacterium sp. 77]